jgi:hypothetical protein
VAANGDNGYAYDVSGHKYNKKKAEHKYMYTKSEIQYYNIFTIGKHGSCIRF